MRSSVTRTVLRTASKRNKSSKKSGLGSKTIKTSCSGSKCSQPLMPVQQNRLNSQLLQQKLQKTEKEQCQQFCRLMAQAHKTQREAQQRLKTARLLEARLQRESTANTGKRNQLLQWERRLAERERRIDQQERKLQMLSQLQINAD